MKLSEIVGAAGLAIYAEVALVIFLFAFVAIVIHVTSKANRADFDAAGSLPLSDGDMTEGADSKGARR